LRIYYMDSDLLLEDALYHRLLQRCSAARREKLETIQTAAGKRNSLAAAVLLDLALQTRGIREQNVKYEYGETGKPSVCGIPGFHFSISHSGSSVICAVSEQPVGADLQESRPVSERLQHRMFTERERLLADPIRLWTLKESYAKLTGEGISVMERTEIFLEKEPVIRREDVPQPVFFWEKSLRNGSRAATCGYENPSYSIELIEVNRSDLI